jgi:hypothetical protein
MEGQEKENFIKYINVVYPIVKDEMGLPSMVLIDGLRLKLNCSIDRHHFRKVISKYLKEKHFFSDETAQQGGELYCETKYNEYKEVVLNL